MKNVNQKWRGLTQELFNPQLFKETLEGDDVGSGESFDDSTEESSTIDEMNYDDFVDLINAEKEAKKAQRESSAKSNPKNEVKNNSKKNSKDQPKHDSK